MQRRWGWWYFALTMGCGTAPATSAATKTPIAKPPLEATDGSHAPLYPILSSAELRAIRTRASAAAPGWTISVDSLGRLMIATCDICSSREASVGPGGGGFSAADHHLVEMFLHNEEALVHFNAPFVTLKKGNLTGGVLFEQETPVGLTGWVSAHFGRGGKVEVVGSAWPRLPPTEGAKTDDELEAALHKVIPTLGLTHKSFFICVARSKDGPVELHRAACLEDDSGRVRACVDAFTGEDLTPLEVRLTTNGIVPAVPVPRPPSLVSATQVLTTMQARYAGTLSLRARFVERRYLDDPLGVERAAPSKPLPQVLTGWLTFVRPNLIGWSYDNLDKVVSDGNQVAVYSQAASSVRVQVAEPSPYVAPLFFFAGNNIGSITFQAQTMSGLRRPGPSTTVVGHPAFRAPDCLGELFAVDSTGEVGVFGIIGAHHIRQDFELSGAVENVSIDPADLVLDLPASVTRIGPASPLVRLAKPSAVGKK